MRHAGALFLLPLLGLLLVTGLAAGDETLPGGLIVLASDEYAEEVETGGTASFSWGVVNSGAGQADFSANGTISSSGYNVTVEPASFVLSPGDAIVVYANVTVPLRPQSPRADLEVRLQLGDGRHTHLRATVVAKQPASFVDMIIAFFAIGAIIFIGFFASLVFERTKIPDLVFLIILGLFLGPILSTFFGISLIPVDLLRLATPYFAALALMIILFDGGLNLRLRQVVSRAGVSIVHTSITFLGTVAAITIIAMMFLGYPLWVGVLLGVILGGTSGAVVIGVVRGISIGEDSRTILVLEATITDVLCIIGALTVIGILRGGGTLTGTIGGLLTAFSVALLLGVIAGILWLRVLSGMVGKPFGFMITIAALFVLYAATEVLGGSGGMAALVFGLILGNHRAIARVLRIKEPLRVDESFKRFQSEITFGIRTFFFVFLGFSFTLPFATSWEVQASIPIVSLLNNTFWLLLLATVLIFLGIYGMRILAAAATTRVAPETREDRRAIVSMMGRGLAAAVLASLPFAIPAFTDPAHPEYPVYHAAMVRYETPFLTIAFLIILVTVIATTVGVVAAERHKKAAIASVPKPLDKPPASEMQPPVQQTHAAITRKEQEHAQGSRRIEKKAHVKAKP